MLLLTLFVRFFYLLVVFSLIYYEHIYREEYLSRLFCVRLCVEFYNSGSSVSVFFFSPNLCAVLFLGSRLLRTLALQRMAQISNGQMCFAFYYARRLR
jgi:hypothetical protein